MTERDKMKMNKIKKLFMPRSSVIITVGIALLGVTIGQGAAAELAAPYDLRVEGLANSMVIDRSAPAFSWKLKDDRRGAAQSAYRILVASTPDRLVEGKADLWDSGKVIGDQSLYVPYAGAKLSSNQRAFWKVCLWDQDGQASPFSDPARFQMSLLDPKKEWTAKWIQPPDKPLVNKLTDLWTKMALIPQPEKGLNEYNWELMNTLRPSPLLRREFTLPSIPVIAILRSCNLGYGENWINGRKVGDGYFDPATTHYPVYALFNTYDVTDLLKQGKNVLGIMLGNGWFDEPLAWSKPDNIYGRPMASAQLLVEMENGQTVTLTTDGHWKTAPGPILRDHCYIGECYDARAMPAGWDQPGFDDSKWDNVLVTDSPTEKLKAQKVQSEKIVRRVKPVAVRNPAQGIYVFDMGEMLVGFPEINVPAGQTNPVIVRSAEWAIGACDYKNLKRDATPLYYEHIKNPFAIDGMLASKPRCGAFYSRGFHGDDGTSVSKWSMAPPTSVYQGTGEAARWHPRFALGAFRYVEVQGLQNAPDMNFITGCVVHTAVTSTGTFTSSEKLYEDIYQAAMNSSLYTMHNMTWDNPCERAQQPMQHSEVFPLLAMSCDAGPFMKKLIGDFAEVRKKNGATVYIPYTRRTSIEFTQKQSPGAKQDSPDVNLPWQYYLYYGDQRVLEEHFPSIEKFINFFYGPDNPYQKERYKYLRPGGYENHLYQLMVNGGEPALTIDRYAYTSAWLHLLIRRAAVIAGIIGRPDKEKEYNTLADNIRAEYHKTWPTTKNKGYGSLNDKQTKKPDLSRGNMIGNPLGITSGVAPESDWRAMADNMAYIMTNDYHGHLVCEPQTVIRNLRVLSDYGYVDLAADWMSSTNPPSYGYMLSYGTKTVWEGFADPTNHKVPSTVQNEFQAGANWLQESLCGVRPDIAGPGMKHFFLEPKIPGKVASAGTEFESPYGKVKSSWSQKDGIVTWAVRVPANSTATVEFPDHCPLAKVTESRKPLAEAAGVSVVKADGAAKVSLAAGSYRFEFPGRQK